MIKWKKNIANFEYRRDCIKCPGSYQFLEFFLSKFGCKLSKVLIKIFAILYNRRLLLKNMFLYGKRVVAGI